MKAFQVDDMTVFAARNADEAIQVYHEWCGDVCEDGYPRELDDDELDRLFPDTDENEAPTGEMTSLRVYLNEMTEPGYLAGEA